MSQRAKSPPLVAGLSTGRGGGRTTLGTPVQADEKAEWPEALDGEGDSPDGVAAPVVEADDYQ